MGCNTCGSGNSVANSVPRQKVSVKTSPEECIYTLQILQNWNNRLLCIKENQTFDIISSTAQEINGFLGVVQSAMSNPNNICYFASHLSLIGNTIVKIINSGQC